jgi:DNA (cytosine-5)-methyltransferase 1
MLDSSTVVTGFDVSADACATARAAGYHRVQADVRSLEPADFPDITGLIVSPPCPTFSSSGLRSALSGDDYQHALDAITCLGEGCSKTWHHLPGKVSDPRTALVVQTARWVLRLPAVKWVIAEQVPSVEFLWEDLAAELAAAGWEYMNVETIDAHDLGAVARRPANLPARLPLHRRRAHPRP